MSQTTRFSDNEPQWMVDVGTNLDSTCQIADDEMSALANFLSRPIRISADLWPVGGAFSLNLDPWTLFLEHPLIRTRIQNYNLLRCRLCIKCLVNGSPLHFGRLMVTYDPLGVRNDFYLPLPPTSDQAFVITSQRPKFFVNPACSQGGMMKLPFLFPNNALRVPGNDWSSLGRLDIVDIAPLQHANGGTNPVTITFYAWAEDVVLSIPTAEQFVPASGDEYGTGVVSKPAAAIAAAAGKLSNVPVIGPYARATEMAASMTSTVAKAMGYSRPVQVTDPNPVRHTPLGNLVNTDRADTSTKLSVDTKQELSVDPRIVGALPQDELSISSIVTRESYWTDFMWTGDDNVDTFLKSMRVSPSLAAGDNADGYRFFTAMAFGSAPFTFWRGSIKFRFIISASKMHRGRLRAVWDPNTSTVPDAGICHQVVMDLEDGDDFCMEVGWGNKHGWARTYPIPPARNPDMVGTDYTQLVADDNYDNGILSIYVMNTLVGPNDLDNTVYVNVFVSAGDNFEVCVPTQQTLSQMSFFPNSLYTPQSGSITSEALDADYDSWDSNVHYQGELSSPSRTYEQISKTYYETFDAYHGVITTHVTRQYQVFDRRAYSPQSGEEECDAPDQVQAMTIAPQIPSVDNSQYVWFGDPCVSFRDLLKRYNYYGAYHVPGSNTTPTAWTIKVPDFPYYRGASAVSCLGQTAAAVPYNYVNTTLLTYLTPAFIVRRGGIRYKYLYSGSLSSQDTFNMSAARLGPYDSSDIFVSTQSTLLLPASSSASQRMQQSLVTNPQGLGGMVATSTKQNPVLELELPDYNKARFREARYSNYPAHFPLLSGHVISTTHLSSTTNTPHIDAFVSAADDYSLSMYVGPPAIWFTSSTPPA